MEYWWFEAKNGDLGAFWRNSKMCLPPSHLAVTSSSHRAIQKWFFLYSRGGMLVIWAKKRSAGCIFKKIGKTSTSNILMLRNGRKWVGSILIFWKPIILAFQNWFDFQNVPHSSWSIWCRLNSLAKSTPKNILFGDIGQNMTFFRKQKKTYIEIGI